MNILKSLNLKIFKTKNESLSLEENLESYNIWKNILHISNGISELSNLNVNFLSGNNPQNDDNPHYSYTTAGKYRANTIYLPRKFDKNNIDYLNSIEKHLQEKTSLPQDKLEKIVKELVIAHELGHARQHKSIEDQKPYNEPIKFNQGHNLEYLYNGATMPNKSNIYLSEICKEAYADCFSALVIYKEYGDINVFDAISIFRKESYQARKLKNIESIHPNDDYESILIFKEEFKRISKPINQIVFSDIEDILEKSLMKGNLKTLEKELKINDAFLTEFRNLAKDFNIRDWKIKDCISEAKKQDITISANVIDTLKNDIKNSSILSFFTEFQNRTGTEEIISNAHLLDLVKDKILEREVTPINELANIKSIIDVSNFEIKEKKQINCNILNIRENSIHKNNNSIKIKIN